MNTIRTLVILVSLLVPTAALSQTDDEKTAMVDRVASEISTKHGISKDAALDYLKVGLAAIKARAKAQEDQSKLSALYADMLERYASTYIAGQIVIAEGRKIIEEIKAEPVGTVIPQERVAVINKWAGRASALNTMTSNAVGAHMTWTMERFTSSSACARGAMEFNSKKCIELMNATLDEFQSMGNTLEAATKTVSVILFAVMKRMSY